MGAGRNCACDGLALMRSGGAKRSALPVEELHDRIKLRAPGGEAAMVRIAFEAFGKHFRRERPDHLIHRGVDPGGGRGEQVGLRPG